jgi:arsenate reductase
MSKKKVLFVCIHNSARSQMAEAFLNAMAPDRFEAESAGIEPGPLNPTVVKAMQEAGIDLSENKTKSVQQFLDEGRQYDYIITVCDEASVEHCPVFPGKGQRFHMGFADPSSFRGSEGERLEMTIAVRDQIKVKIEQWIKENSDD